MDVNTRNNNIMSMTISLYDKQVKLYYLSESSTLYVKFEKMLR